MDKAQLVRDMAESFYAEYRKKCQNLSDRELKDISLKNSRLVGSTPVDANNFQTISRYYAEGMVCKEILEQRKQREEEVKRWRQGLPARREKAILNLSAAVSELGQLIAAILEFRGGLTLKEIVAEVKEYQEAEEADIVACLNGLEQEEIVYQTGDTYRLLTVCTPSLFPENILEFARNAFEKHNTKFEDDHIKVLKLIEAKGMPLSEAAIRESIENIGHYSISGLSLLGVLDVSYLNDDDIDGVYYFKMLGERSC